MNAETHGKSAILAAIVEAIRTKLNPNRPDISGVMGGIGKLLHASLTIEDVLDTLPAAYDRPLYAQKCSALFEHVCESYPERDANVYASVA